MTRACLILLTLVMTWLRPLPGLAAEFDILADQKTTGTAAALCLAVDRSKALKHPARAETYFPVIAAQCNSSTATLQFKWDFNDRRELFVTVNGARLCLSARYMTGFTPLVQAFLDAFHAGDANSPFAYLIKDLKPNGVNNDARLNDNPPLVVGTCGQPDASDHWVYDDNTGLISGVGGASAKGWHRPQCVTIQGDWNVRPVRYADGMPVSAATCPALDGFERTAVLQQRWRIGSGQDRLPTYRPPRAGTYFDGTAGLPITGPMGRCLSLDKARSRFVTADCDAREEQNWKVIGQTIQTGAGDGCLTRAPDGTLLLSSCTGDTAQKWQFTVREPVFSLKEPKREVYGQFQSAETPSQCLVVSEDPFIDPVYQGNVVKLAGCQSVLPRQTSWFFPTRVQTLRLALLRFANDDGSNPALGKLSDDDAKKTMEGLARYLSEQYRVLGLRFVFDPDSDYVTRNSTLANQMANNPLVKVPKEAELEVFKVAAQDLYGKATIATTAAKTALGGGYSSAAYSEFEPERTRNEITPGAPKIEPPPVLDRAGVPALSYIVVEAFLTPTLRGSSHHAHEFGHYFGLRHTHGPDELADTPHEISVPEAWYQIGSTTCGNPRTVVAKGQSMTPDRNNNEGYWGCNMARSRNSFSPLQLAKASLVLATQLNRYPLVACQPLSAYDANKLECENAESLAQCQQTAGVLQKRFSVTMTCRAGGAHARRIDEVLKYPAVTSLLTNTPAGRAFVNKLAGLGGQGAPVPAAVQSAVERALRSNDNLALTMALLKRVDELREATVQMPWAKSAYQAGGALPSSGTSVIAKLSTQVLSADFIRGAPVLLRKN